MLFINRALDIFSLIISRHLVPQENIIDYSLGILSNRDNAFPFFAVLNCFFLLEIPAMYEI